ncbi:MAG: hypothetical protein WBP65_22095 [Candidatus Sulfotelmatobacter sp.]|jgi:hypothetical protein
MTIAKFKDCQETTGRRSASSRRASTSTQIETIFRFAPGIPTHDLTFSWGFHNFPALVEYNLTVPRAARLNEIKLINGSLAVTGATGEVHASCINGKLEAHNLSGRAELSTINGVLKATFDQLPASNVELSSVNGVVELTIPSDSKAEIEASTSRHRP